MRFVLINPGQRLSLQGNNPKIIDKERGKNPPLGLLYVAAAVKEAGRHQVNVIDANLPGFGQKTLAKFFSEDKCDVLGITITSFTLLDAIEVIKLFKKVNPRGKVVAGGPHVAIYPRETLGLGLIDVVVKREGEPVINGVLDRLDNPASLQNVHGICFRFNGDIIDTGEASFIEDLDSLPFPDRSFLPYKEYFSLLGGDAYSTTIFTSRGCPFRCAFCDRPAMGKKFRCHGPDYVVREICRCLDLGIREFLFYDDTFTVKRQRVLDICKQIIDLGQGISWDIRARVDTVDEEILLALKQAGCQAVHYGVESGSERILERLNKGISLGRVREVFRLTQEVGMDTLAYFMIGSPGETRDDIKASLDLARALNPDMLHLTIFTPFPATQLYREALDAGIIGTDVWREFASNPRPDFVPPIWQENLSKADLQEIITQAYQKFYVRPSYIWKRLRRLRSLSEFKRKAKAGLSVLRMRG